MTNFLIMQHVLFYYHYYKECCLREYKCTCIYAALNNVVLNQTNYLIIWVITLDSEPLVANSIILSYWKEGC